MRQKRTKLKTGDQLPSFCFSTNEHDDLESLSILKGKTVF